MKVFVSRLIPDTGLQLLQQAGLQTTVWTEDRQITQQELIEQAKQHDALLCMGSDKMDAHFLTQCQHLKVIAQFSVGYDNVDVAASTRLGIPFGNTPDVLSDATADVAFLLMLAVSRKAFYMHKRIISGDWGTYRPTLNLGVELKNKTLGIFGLGRIGMELARRCRGAYNMKVIYHNRSHNVQAEQELQAQRVSFEELLAQSDVLSVHVALSPETEGKFNADVFRKMKPSSIFINTARGKIHQEQDLIQALNEGWIWGAGLDVTNPEPMKPDNPLLSMPNAAVLPHIGSATVQARNDMARLAAMNIIAGLHGKRLPHCINPEVYKKDKSISN
ncbi:D-glycerate dehydrogenase [Pontibacter qinzhouensis]|uniref:Glyoxylate/hydroxypyruvate reductase B n=1 Tax=Pontibacter qinzhouensis TaxID=2603253 RepID=A0A5C8KCS8_9BACT|nr:D-glycerate dehydrogenase [Pontibacter qinzhouensis]TXK52065.1 D-glycerate dehydrogenase [Pontibacter qinzhouensis]